VDVGSVVTANATPLLSIQRVDPLHVEFTVTEKQLSDVQKHMRTATLKAEVRLPDADEAREGEVTFLDNAVDATTGTVRLRVTVANADGRFWPGRFARVRMLLTTLPNAVLVPAGAPQVSAFGTVVYVAKEATDPKSGQPLVDTLTKQPVRVAEMRPVKVGQRQGDLVVVEGGVAAGDPVIVERSFLVFPGARVVIVTPPAAGHGGPPGSGSAATAAPAPTAEKDGAEAPR
jgi:multidrug efflux system membrane fusion protein